ncbi:hypothetical protein, partial [Salmonella enterica]|uniref:hypothetical protein n=1 Tax=Salmonella enterica TaxID=28901 RepID=UPI002FCDA39E
GWRVGIFLITGHGCLVVSFLVQQLFLIKEGVACADQYRGWRVGIFLITGHGCLVVSFLVQQLFLIKEGVA